MKIAILGSTSQIAKSIIPHLGDHELRLFCRCMENFKKFGNEKYDIVINFVGAGSPHKIRELGMSIVDINDKYDNMVLEYLKKHKKTKYIYISSGIVHELDDSIYRYNKIQTENRHRLHKEFNIIDMRIYSYFSRYIKETDGFFMSEVIRCVKNKQTLKVIPLNIVRDYIAPMDLADLIVSIEPSNCALDLYSKKPIQLSEILDYFSSEYGLIWETMAGEYASTGGSKEKYYAKTKFWFRPRWTSLETIVNEAREIL